MTPAERLTGRFLFNSVGTFARILRFAEQSIRKVHFTGGAKECRAHVQRANLLRGIAQGKEEEEEEVVAAHPEGERCKDAEDQSGVHVHTITRAALPNVVVYLSCCVA